MARGRVDVWAKLLGGKTDDDDIPLPYSPAPFEELQRLQDEAKNQKLPPIPMKPQAS